MVGYGSRENFEVGRPFEDANYLALREGLQIVICQKQELSNNHIFMTPKASEKTKFIPSKEGKKVVEKYGPINRENTEHVSVIEDYLSIPGKDRKFWKEMKEEKIFYMWAIEGGPRKFFEGANKMLLWVLRVYELPFTLTKEEDYGALGRTYKIFEDKGSLEKLVKIINLYESDELDAVIESNEEFYERKKKIKEIIDKHR